jgi:hypothetical protein
MTITLDHTIVPAHDKIASAKFHAELLGLSFNGVVGHFAPVQINEALTFDFDDRWKNFQPHHYAFHVSDGEFDAIFGRIKAAQLPYGSTPWTATDMKVDESAGGRTVYFSDPNSHYMELRTVPMVVELSDPDLPDLRQRAGLAAR